MKYKDAGVDIQAGDELVDWLASEKSSHVPHRHRIIDGIGGFASLFRFDFPDIKKPCLVTCTDGVGTKVKLAAQYNNYSGIGQDLVAMCVNDLICTGGKPMVFLDYYAVGKLDLQNAKAFLTSVKKACAEAEVALVGGETAEMPGVYQGADFDCAGFAVGVVDEDKALKPSRVQAGDVVIGVSSSGFHSNGYSLLRKVFQADLDQWQEVLLRPTALYVKLALDVYSQCEVHGAAHITGGGIENVPRVLPESLKWEIKYWPWPDEFQEVQRRTQMTRQEMLTTLNCGLGFCFIAPAGEVEKIRQIIRRHGFRDLDVGHIREIGRGGDQA